MRLHSVIEEQLTWINYLLHWNRLLSLALELFNDGLVVPGINLGTHKNLRHIRAEMHHFRVPLCMNLVYKQGVLTSCAIEQQHKFTITTTTTYFCGNVFKRNRVNQRKANQKDLSISITKGSQTIILFLASCVNESKNKKKSAKGSNFAHNNNIKICIPQAQLNVPVTSSEVHHVIVKHLQQVSKKTNKQAAVRIIISSNHTVGM